MIVMIVPITAMVVAVMVIPVDIVKVAGMIVPITAVVVAGMIVIIVVIAGMVIVVTGMVIPVTAVVITGMIVPIAAVVVAGMIVIIVVIAGMVIVVAVVSGLAGLVEFTDKLDQPRLVGNTDQRSPDLTHARAETSRGNASVQFLCSTRFFTEITLRRRACWLRNLSPSCAFNSQPIHFQWPPRPKPVSGRPTGFTVLTPVNHRS